MTETSVSRIEVTYTLGDIYAVTAQAWRQTALIIFIAAAILLAAMIAMPIVLFGTTFQQSLDLLPWQTCVGGLLFLLLLYFGGCPLIGYLRLKRQGILGPHRFSFLDGGLRVETPREEALIYWPTLKRVTANDSRLFLFVGIAVAFVVPRRDFRDAAEFEAAIAEAKARYSTANR